MVTGGTLAGFGTVASPLALAGTLYAQNGTLTLGGGLTGSGTVTVDAGARLRLAGGSYAASFGGFGIVEATSGSVVLTAPLSGALQLRVVAGTTLDVGAALDLGAAGASTMVFGGANARLAFGVAGGFSGIIAGFQTTDVLELKNIAATSASAAPAGLNSLLTLTTASGSVTLRLAGDYSGKSFAAHDIGMAIARGIPLAGKYKTEHGLVLFMALEAERSVMDRHIAHRQVHGIYGARFAFLTYPLELNNDR